MITTKTELTVTMKPSWRDCEDFWGAVAKSLDALSYLVECGHFEQIFVEKGSKLEAERKKFFHNLRDMYNSARENENYAHRCVEHEAKLHNIAK